MISRDLERRITKLEKLIYNEAKQAGTLYHVCSLNAYLKYILPKDQLRASGSYYNYIYGGNDYISFTRDKYFVVGLLANTDIVVQLVIDGNKLSENYKIGPYNDFAFDDNGKIVKDNPRDREMEEVVRGPIKNISKYIKEVRIDFHDMDQFVINELKKNISKLKNCVYYNFVKDKSPKFQDFARKSEQLKNGTPITDLVAKNSDLYKYFVITHPDGYMLSFDLKNIKYGVECGLDVNKQYGPSKIYPIEFLCDDDEYANIIKFLLNSGADPNTITKNGDPILSVAVTSYCTKIVKLLIKAGADVNKKDSNGDTPLMDATSMGAEDLVRLLLKSGANANIKNDDDKTALDLVHRKDTEIANMLTKATNKKNK